MLLLDTDVIIDLQRRHPAAIAWSNSLATTPSIPGLVAMELIQGAQARQQVRQALKLMAPLPIVWPTVADCQRALADFTTLHLSHRIGLLDCLIAATAVGASAELCTFNTKHFGCVPGLVTIQPYTR